MGLALMKNVYLKINDYADMEKHVRELPPPTTTDMTILNEDSTTTEVATVTETSTSTDQNPEQSSEEEEDPRKKLENIGKQKVGPILKVMLEQGKLQVALL